MSGPKLFNCKLGMSRGASGRGGGVPVKKPKRLCPSCCSAASSSAEQKRLSGVFYKASVLRAGTTPNS